MSHIARIEISIRDLESLKSAVEMLGLVWSEKKTYRWFNRFMNDTPLPKGIKVEDLGKCDYCISVPNNKKAYEVGVVKMPDGTYTLLYDYWQRGYGLEDIIGSKAHKLVQEYSVALGKKKLKKLGYTSSQIKRTVDEHGKIRLKAVN